VRRGPWRRAWVALAPGPGGTLQTPEGGCGRVAARRLVDLTIYARGVSGFVQPNLWTVHGMTTVLFTGYSHTDTVRTTYTGFAFLSLF
jgi:hypothetical protein